MSQPDGKMKWVNQSDWHGGAGTGAYSKEKIRTQLIEAHPNWKKFEGGKYTKNGEHKNFDFVFHKSGEIQVKKAGTSGSGKGTGIMWRDLEIMRSAHKNKIIIWEGDKDALPPKDEN